MRKPSIIKNKDFLTIIQHIQNKVGENGTGALISILADSLDKLTEGGNDVSIRSMEIIYNDLFTYKQVFEE